MHLKDYYKILGLSPDASLPEIKKSYRRLAMQYHPDKNGDDKIAAAYFKEIKEAYEILNHPVKRESYHQQRWYNQAIGKRVTNRFPLTPHSLLQECLFLDKYVSTLNKFRIDYEGLYLYIIQMLSYDTIESINHFNEPETNRSIINTLLGTATPLPYKYALKLGERLMLLTQNDEEMNSRITNYQEIQKRKQDIEKYKIVIVAFIVLIICIIIYYASKG
jgi:molecular chaperone DnaJ